MALNNIENTLVKRKQLSEYQRGQIIAFFECKKTYAEISDKVDVPISTIGYVIKAYKTKGVTVPPKRTGKPKVFTDRTKSAMERAFRSAPFAPITLQHQRFVAGGMKMSRSTFVGRMKDLGYASYSPARKPALNDKQRGNRLKWCQERVDWTPDQWRSVIWSDESRFMLVGNDGGIRVVRKAGERYLEQHVLHTHKFGKGSIMVWGCFWAGGLGPLVTLTGTVNQEKYVDCLANNFLPWYQKLVEGNQREYIFQEDGAPCHTGGYTTWYKRKRCDVKSFDFWPAQSPDLNPIEHLWAYIAHKLRDKRGELANLAQLEAFVHKTWSEIPSQILESLISSMPERYRAVVANNGGTTRY